MELTNFEKSKEVMKAPHLRALLLLKEGPKTWSDFEKVMNKGQVSLTLRRLIEMKLVETNTREKGLQKTNIYYLTPYGKAVLEKLEELEDLLQAIAETPTEEKKKELVEKALSGKLKYCGQD